MTDREKLDYIKTEIQDQIRADKVISRSMMAMERISMCQDILSLINKLTIGDYRPSSRPCFDKPAGVAILHEETV